MHQLSRDDLTALVTATESPCLSLYQPTHRRPPDTRQDPIRYRNLVRELEGSLRQRYPARDIGKVLAPFEALVDDMSFWNRRTEGLAIFGSPERFDVIGLQRPVKPLAVVADSFHTKPLFRILQSADRFQILCLTRRAARLFEGNRDSLDEIELTRVPSTMTAALGEELTEPNITATAVGRGVGGSPGHGAVYHGHLEKSDEIDADMARFGRIVDRGILEHHSRPSGLPLMLAALAEHHAGFREVSRNPFLLPDGLQLNPDAVTVDELREQAWRKREPSYLSRLAELVDGYHAAAARGLGSDDLVEVARAAVAGRVGILLVEADREIPGRIGPDAGVELSGDLSEPGTDDVLDDLAETVFRMGGEVVVVPAERMPVKTGAAATYRF